MNSLRVNGIVYSRIEMRYQIVDGYPGGPLECVVHDRVLGDIVLSPACKLEIEDERNRPYHSVSLNSLLDRLKAQWKEQTSLAPQKIACKHLDHHAR